MGLPWPRSLFGRNVLVLAAATALSVILCISALMNFYNRSIALKER